MLGQMASNQFGLQISPVKSSLAVGLRFILLCQELVRIGHNGEGQCLDISIVQTIWWISAFAGMTRTNLNRYHRWLPVDWIMRYNVLWYR